MLGEFTVSTQSRIADPAEFRRAAGRFASGVTVVTSRRGSLVYGITVSAFASFSVDPLQVLVSIWRGNRLHDMIRESGVFAVSVLLEGQRSVSEYFATPGRAPVEDSFPEIEVERLVTGAPVIAGCLAHFDCRVTSSFTGSDHTIFIGEVRAVGSRDGQPLLYYSRDYRGLRDWEDAAEATGS
jgi:flavin reductase (DIM6/NTAB) family NADH-FMN oxidoreductase RutF